MLKNLAGFVFICLLFAFSINCNLAVSLWEGLGNGDAREDIADNPADGSGATPTATVTPTPTAVATVTPTTVATVTPTAVATATPTAVATVTPGVTPTVTPVATVTAIPTLIPPFPETPAPDPAGENIYFLENNFAVNQGDLFKLSVAANTGDNYLGSYTVIVSFDPTMLMLDPMRENGSIAAEAVHDSLRITASSANSVQVNGVISTPLGFDAALALFSLHFRVLNDMGNTVVYLRVSNMNDQSGLAIGNPIGDSCHLVVNNA